MGSTPFIFLIVVLLPATRCSWLDSYGRSPHYETSIRYQTPLETMVDVTNDLAVSVLQDYAFSRGNFAFSPYGVTSVLVVLYEGARGETARQIHHALRLPWNKDVTRLGFRDIHRYLRSYFTHEGYLSGMTLSKNQTALLPEFQKILQFYGYDIDLGKNETAVTYPPTETTEQTITETTTIQSLSTESSTIPEPYITETSDMPEGTSTIEETATTEDILLDTETTTSMVDKDVEEEDSSDTDKKKESMKNKNSSTGSMSEEDTSTMAIATFQTTENLSQVADGSNEEDKSSEESDVEKEKTDEKNTTGSTNSPSSTTEIPREDTKSTPSSESLSTINDQKTESSQEDSKNTSSSETDSTINEQKTETTIQPKSTQMESEEDDVSDLVEKKRKTRSIGDEPPLHMGLRLDNGMYDSYVNKESSLYEQLPRFPFCVDGSKEERVPVMAYTTVFPFAYVRKLNALALEFSLDDPRYKLLMILPLQSDGLPDLIQGLKSYPLRHIQEALRPTRVNAVIPSFMVEGFVILTPSLQQMGIWDVFDPRRCNLSGMTDDPELFVRNIEQSITVVIRNYLEVLDIHTQTMAARMFTERFFATHPFLYFVTDTETRISLMAGKIVDPLNSRIY